jgi:hypothetical protein
VDRDELAADPDDLGNRFLEDATQQPEVDSRPERADVGLPKLTERGERASTKAHEQRRAGETPRRGPEETQRQGRDGSGGGQRHRG